MLKKELLEAFTTRDLAFLKEMLDENNINEVDHNGQNLLVYAIRNLDFEIMRLLLDKGIDTNFRLRYNETILHIAANIGSNEIMKILLTYAPDLINIKNDFGVAPIHIVCKRGLVEVLEYMIEAGADIDARDENNESILHFAIVSGNTGLVEYILDTLSFDINVVDSRNKTALHKACEKGLSNMIEFLIYNNINYDLSDNAGNLAIHYAASNGSVTDLKYLIKNGSSIYTLNNKLESVKDIAVNRLNLDNIEFLELIEGDIQYFENKTNSKVQLSVKRNDLILMRTLLNENNVNELDDFMKNALYYAICLGRTVFARTLLEKTPVFKQSLIGVALTKGNKELISLLEEKVN